MTRRSAAAARSHTRAHLTAWEWAGDTGDATLIVSELVTNAVRHSARPGRELRLKLTLLESGELLIDVSDPVAAFPGFGRAVEPEESEERGRGLLVVQGLGARLSWSAGPDIGKTVRAALAAR
ncbi:ATP-binding protein [Streptomyces jumonjinensis]|uniref:ATP-binding protein n=2 Tax=Streptomyces jumonjinensis TaxID=1945 RepID=A0A646KGY1_STRJU|nr:ATP-binding protein [Streptomyces jumonjinensis]